MSMSSDMVNKTLMITEGALCVAASVILSFVVLFRLPQDGALTVEMAPIMLFSLRRGAPWGVLCGLLSGLLMMMFGGYVVHPLQGALDYPIAYALVGLVGCHFGSDVIGVVMVFCLRLSAHVLSGVIFFAEYAPEWQSPWIYSLLYNAGFLVPSTILSWAVSLVLIKAVLPRRMMV